MMIEKKLESYNREYQCSESSRQWEQSVRMNSRQNQCW